MYHHLLKWGCFPRVKKSLKRGTIEWTSAKTKIIIKLWINLHMLGTSAKGGSLLAWRKLMKKENSGILYLTKKHSLYSAIWSGGLHDWSDSSKTSISNSKGIWYLMQILFMCDWRILDWMILGRNPSMFEFSNFKGASSTILTLGSIATSRASGSKITSRTSALTCDSIGSYSEGDEPTNSKDHKPTNSED